MKVHFNTLQEAVLKYPNYTPKNSKKIHNLGKVDYCKIGSVTKTHHLAWRIGCFFKAIKLVFSFWDFSKKKRKLISKNLKEFSTSKEKILDIYVKRHSENQKIPKQEQVILQEKNFVPKEKKHDEILLNREPMPAEAVNPQLDAQPLEEDPDALILNNYEKLYDFLNESLWKFENQEDVKRNLLRIIPKITNVTLEQLIAGRKPLHWRGLLRICYFHKNLPQDILNKMAEIVKQGLENKDDPVIVFPKSEIVGLSMLKLSLHPRVLSLLKDYYSSMATSIFSETLLDIPEEFLDQFLLIFYWKQSKKEEVEDFVKELIGQCCQRTDLNLLSPKQLFHLLSKTEYGLSVPNLLKITPKKITETIQFIYQIIRKNGIYDDGFIEWENNTFGTCMITLFDKVPQNETRIQYLSTILLEMEERDIIGFLTSDKHDFDVACRILLQACVDVKHKRFESVLDAILDVHAETDDTSDKNEWKKLAQEASVDQALYMLSKPHEGLENFKDALFVHAIEKDVKRCCEQIPKDNFFNYLRRIRILSETDQNASIQLERLLKEIQNQAIQMALKK